MTSALPISFLDSLPHFSAASVGSGGSLLSFTLSANPGKGISNGAPRTLSYSEESSIKPKHGNWKIFHGRFSLAGYSPWGC